MRDPTLFRELLERKPDRFEPGTGWQGRRILVTGAAGFIGSILCRKLIRSRPERILALDHAEGNLARLARRAADWPHGERFQPVLADVRDSRRMGEILAEFQPALVVHAAAYKHVSLLEHHPFETIENNTLSTAALAKLAQRFAVETMVLVSTDKAADPVSIMGASKYLAERSIVFDRMAAPTRFAALRCGNVIGSTGSVLPVWREQIRAGRSVTVSDRQAERFFLFPQEAVNALLQVSQMAKAGLYSYAMHAPVNIGHLAERTVELLAGGKEIVLDVTGLQPGEKLRESQAGTGEHLRPTLHPQIVQVVQENEGAQSGKLMRELEAACLTRSLPQLLRTIGDAIPAYGISATLQANSKLEKKLTARSPH